VLEIHGDKDSAVSFEGGHVLKMADMPLHRSAMDTVRLWSHIDACSSGPVERERLDIMPNLDGDETIDLRFSGCKAPVALWRVTGGDHFIAVSHKAFDAIWTYLQAAK
jgi:poly(3-hydroxybutyrate) depolymerase